MAKLGVGVVGVGTLGKRHAENLRHSVSGAQLVAVSDSDESAPRKWPVNLKSSTPTIVSRRLWNGTIFRPSSSPRPPNITHREFELLPTPAKMFFREKPLALSLEEADEALNAVAKAGVRLQIGFMRRYDPAYLNARNRIETGEIGDPVIFKSVGRDKEPPPPSFLRSNVNGTLFSDAAIHDFDLVRWLMGDEVVAVQCFAGLLACPELAEFNAIDACLVNLRLVRGGIGSVEAFRKSTYGYDIRTEILGTKGALHVGYLRHTADLVLTAAGVLHDVVDHWLARLPRLTSRKCAALPARFWRASRCAQQEMTDDALSL